MSGVARAGDGFKLARAGVFAFLEKPVTAGQILSLVHGDKEREPPAIGPFIREQLGREGVETAGIATDRERLTAALRTAIQTALA